MAAAALVSGELTAPEARSSGALARNSWWLYLAAMTALTCGYGLAHAIGPAWLRSGLVFNLIGGSAVVALVSARAATPAAAALPWYLFAIGAALFVTSGVLSYNYERLFGTAQPFPSVADQFHLAFYPFLVGGDAAAGPRTPRPPRPRPADRLDDRHHRARDAAVGLPDRALRRADQTHVAAAPQHLGRLPGDGHPRARRRGARGRRQPPPRAGVPVRARRRDRAADHRRDLRLEAARRRLRDRWRAGRRLGRLLHAARSRRAAPLDAAAVRARAGARHAPDAPAAGAAREREPDGAAA